MTGFTVVTFFSMLYISGTNELTSQMLWKLSGYITSESDIRHLGLIGLKLPGHVIDTTINNNRSEINMAAYKVLHQWEKSQSDLKEAYATLCAALKQSGMASYIGKALR